MPKHARVQQVSSTSPPTPLAVRQQRLAYGTVIAVLVTGPLVFLPHNVLFYGSHDTPRRLLLALGVGFLLGLLFQEWAANRKMTWRFHWLDLMVIVFVGCAVISSACSPYLHVCFLAPLWTHDCLPLLLLGAGMYAGMKGWLRSPQGVYHAAFMMVMTGGLVALLGITDRFIGLGFSSAFSNQRLVATLGNPMFTGTYLAMLIPLGIGTALAAVNARHRNVLFLVCAVMMIALVLTLTRGAWVGFALTLISLLFIAPWRMRHALPAQVNTLWMGGIIVCLLLGGLLALLPQVRERITSLADLQGGTVKTRLVYMQAAVNIYHARPLLGWGPGTFRLVFPQYRPNSDIAELGIPINRGYCSALPHNLPLQIAGELGALGLAAFAVLLCGGVVTAFRLMRGDPQSAWLAFGILGLLTAYLLCNLFAFDNAMTYLHFWMGLALLAALGARESFRVVSNKMTLCGLKVTSILILLGTSVAVACQGMAAYYTNRGVMQSAAPLDPVAGMSSDTGAYGHAAIQDLHRAAAVSLLPHYVNYRHLTLAYKRQLRAAQLTGDAQTENVARQAMLVNGEKTLKILDREPDALRCLLIEYTEIGELEKARRYAERLLEVEPYSAEVRLYVSGLLVREEQWAQAQEQMRIMIALDQTFPVGYYHLARYQFVELEHILGEKVPGRDPKKLVTGQDPEGSLTIAGICENYLQAVALGATLTAQDQLRFATALALRGDTGEMLAEGRKLQGTSGLDTLCDRISYFYWLKDREDEGTRLIDALRQPMPAPNPRRPPELPPLLPETRLLRPAVPGQ